MNICCPACQFSREVPEEHLPKRTAIATCPKCGCRFRFSVSEGVLETLKPGVGQRSEKDEKSAEVREMEESLPRQDDPLPEGAIIVKQEASAHEQQQKKEQPFEEPKEKPAETRSWFQSRKLLQQKGGNPWDRAPGRIGWAASFYQTCLRVMFVAPRFFSSLSSNCTQFPALIFYILICLLETILTSGWMMVFRTMIADSSDPQINSLLALLAPKGNFLLMLLVQTVFSAVRLYLVSCVFYAVFLLLKLENNNFMLIFQVVAYSVAPALLCIVPIVGTLAGTIWSCACLAIGLHHAVKATWLQTLLAFIPLLFLMVCSMQMFAQF